MQPENKNDGVQLSTRYQQYCFAKQHLRGTPRPQVFPFGTGDRETHGVLREGGEEQIAPTIRSGYAKAGNTDPYIQQLNTPTHSNNRVYGADGISPTLNTMQGGMRQPFVKDEVRIRRLTPVECERLQGFPDAWTDIVSDTQRYKCLGNAVTVNVITSIFTKLLIE